MKTNEHHRPSHANLGVGYAFVAQIFVFWVIAVAWIHGLDQFPDYQTYHSVSSSGYDFIAESLSHYFLVDFILLAKPTDRLLFFFFLIQLIVCLLTVFITLRYRAYSMALAAYLFFYAPFLLTTVIRNALPYLLVGVLVLIFLERKSFKMATSIAVLACLFHDSAVLPLLALISSQLWVMAASTRIRNFIVDMILIGLFFFALSSPALIFDGADFSELARLAAYASSELNSPIKLIYLGVFVFSARYCYRRQFYRDETKAYLDFLLVSVMLVAVINNVAALRLIPYFSFAIFTGGAILATKVMGPKVYFLLPFLLGLGLLNFSQLVSFD